MRFAYRKELSNTYLMIEDKDLYKQDFQLAMIEENDIDGILKVSVRGVNGKSQYLYAIQDKQSVKDKFQGKRIDADEMDQFLNQIVEILQRMENYMLDTNCLLLNPAYIFCEKEKYWFCYYPQINQNIHASFHELTEYLIGELDFADREGIYMAYELHKRTMKDHYSIIGIMEGIRSSREEKIKTIFGSMEGEEDFFEDSSKDEVVAESSSLFQLPDNPPEKAKKPFFSGLQIFKKKPKWGQWDSLV